MPNVVLTTKFEVDDRLFQQKMRQVKQQVSSIKADVASAFTPLLGAVSLAAFDRLIERGIKFQNTLTGIKAVGGTETFRGLSDALSGVVDKLTIAQATAQLTVAGFKATRQEAEQLGLVARGAAQAGLVPMGEAIDRMSKFLIRGNKILIDDLGVVVNVTQAYKDYASQVGKNVDSLTELEKIQARIQAVMASPGAQNLALLAQLEDAGVTVKTLKSDIEDILTLMGTRLAAGTGGLLSILGGGGNKEALKQRTADILATLAPLGLLALTPGGRKTFFPPMPKWESGGIGGVAPWASPIRNIETGKRWGQYSKYSIIDSQDPSMYWKRMYIGGQSAGMAGFPNLRTWKGINNASNFIAPGLTSFANAYAPLAGAVIGSAAFQQYGTNLQTRREGQSGAVSQTTLLQRGLQSSLSDGKIDSKEVEDVIKSYEELNKELGINVDTAKILKDANIDLSKSQTMTMEQAEALGQALADNGAEAIRLSEAHQQAASLTFTSWVGAANAIVGALSIVADVGIGAVQIVAAAGVGIVSTALQIVEGLINSIISGINSLGRAVGTGPLGGIFSSGWADIGKISIGGQATAAYSKGIFGAATNRFSWVQGKSGSGFFNTFANSFGQVPTAGRIGLEIPDSIPGAGGGTKTINLPQISGFQEYLDDITERRSEGISNSRMYGSPLEQKQALANYYFGRGISLRDPSYLLKQLQQYIQTPQFEGTLIDWWRGLEDADKKAAWSKVSGNPAQATPSFGSFMNHFRTYASSGKIGETLKEYINYFKTYKLDLDNVTGPGGDAFREVNTYLYGKNKDNFMNDIDALDVYDKRVNLLQQELDTIIEIADYQENLSDSSKERIKYLQQQIRLTQDLQALETGHMQFIMGMRISGQMAEADDVQPFSGQLLPYSNRILERYTGKGIEKYVKKSQQISGEISTLRQQSIMYRNMAEQAYAQGNPMLAMQYENKAAEMEGQIASKSQQLGGINKLLEQYAETPGKQAILGALGAGLQTAAGGGNSNDIAASVLHSYIGSNKAASYFSRMGEKATKFFGGGGAEQAIFGPVIGEMIGIGLNILVDKLFSKERNLPITKPVPVFVVNFKDAAFNRYLLGQTTRAFSDTWSRRNTVSGVVLA